MLESRRIAMVALVVWMLAVPMRAQQSNSDAIVRAFLLWRGGQPKAAIAILEPLLQAGAQSASALHDRKGEEAVSTAQEAIDLWTRAHGPEYFLVANGYLLRAQALAHSGDYAPAIRDAQHALAIAETSIGRNTIDYASAEAVYARVLRASGAKREASRMTKEASSALVNLERRQCSSCTIDASGFR
jgi:tetratricopeptide (TPR) repeat protein